MKIIQPKSISSFKAKAREKLGILEAKRTQMSNSESSLKTIEGLLEIVIERYLGI